MVPAGDITEQTIEALADEMAAGDIIIDGGKLLLPRRYPPRQRTGHTRYQAGGLRYERRGLGS